MATGTRQRILNGRRQSASSQTKRRIPRAYFWITLALATSVWWLSGGFCSVSNHFAAGAIQKRDFDLDGDEDLVVANGHVNRFPKGNSVEQFPLLLGNSGAGKLVRQKSNAPNYFGQKWRGRGVAAFDFDDDGDLDLAVSHVNQPAVILENKTKTSGNWCTVELIGNHSNRDCIGSRVVFQTNKNSYLRNIVGGGSYLTQNPVRTWRRRCSPTDEN